MQTNNSTRKLLILLIGVTTAYTVPVSPAELDITQQSAYSAVADQSVELLLPVDMYGIRSRPDDRAVTYFTLLPASTAIDGPEIGSKERLLPGATLRIAAARKRATMFGSEIYYIVTVERHQIKNKFEIRLELSRGNEGDGWASLNPRIYRHVDLPR